MESAFRDARDVTLIETLGWTGTNFPRLGLHLDRLARSARRMGRPCDLADAEAALRAHAPKDAARMRLTLDASGAVAVTASALPAAKSQWRVGLAAETLLSSDPWLSLKSSRRAAYDRARAALPGDLDEAILTNERGEVCDGTITTLFFDAGNGLCTPPLHCGLLPGVLRADMLNRGECVEAVLAKGDLGRARLWVGNSLRGLIPALWTG